MRQELARLSGSASVQPAARKAARSLSEFADEDEIDRVSRKSVAGDGEARHAFALQDLEAHAHDARQDHVGRERVDQAQRQNRRQPASR